MAQPEDNIRTDHGITGCKDGQVDETGSESCSMGNFNIKSAENLDSTTGD
jgi:hypothetical protein